MQLTSLLSRHLSPEQLDSLYLPAVQERYWAAQSYTSRRAAADALAAECRTWDWRSAEVAETLRVAHRDDALLYYDKPGLRRASGNGHDLDLRHHPLAPGLAPAAAEDWCVQALAVVAEPLPDGRDREAWWSALQLEALATLHQLRGDGYLARTLERLAGVEQALLDAAAGRDPFDPLAVELHAAIVELYRQLGVPWRVERAYRRFCAGFAAADPVAAWHARLAADPEFESEARPWLHSIVAAAIDTLDLANPSDTHEIDELRAFLPSTFVPLLLGPNPSVTELPRLPPHVFAAAAEALDHLAAALPPQAGRPAAVLRAWQALAHLGLMEFTQLATTLAPLAADDEALGIAVRSLRGDAGYRLSDYAAAYLDLLHAERLGRAILERRTPDEQAWRPVERDALSRLAQKAGNALLAIGDEAKADAAYARARRLLPDEPLARAADLINQGNLAYQRNNLVDQQGYTTLDAELRQKMAADGPAALQKAKMARHCASLDQAARLYQQALDLLARRPDTDAYAQELAAVAHVDLGNTAWAWGRALEAEDADRLDRLPLPAGAPLVLVQRTSTRADCYRVAIAHQQAALAIAGRVDLADVSLAAAAQANLAELCFLLGEQTGDRADWERGLAAADQAEPFFETGAASLRPELVWRTHFNRARLHEALAQPGQAAASYRDAILAVQMLLAGLSFDTWQAQCLQDKLEVYEGAIRFLHRQDPERHAASIFGLMEQAKGRAFLDLLHSARLPAGLPPELVQRRAEVLAQIGHANEQLLLALQSGDQAAASRWLARQRELDCAWTDVQAQVAEMQWQNADVNPQPAGLAEVQAALGPNRVLLSFLLGMRSSYLAVVDAQAVRVFELPGRRAIELAALPVIYHASRSSAETAREFRRANERLVDLLLGPVDAALGLPGCLAGKHVLVAADGIMHYLPFELLLVDRRGLAGLPETARYPQLQPFYLLSHADASAIPSASVWLHLAARPVAGSAASLLAAYNIEYEPEDVARPLWAMSILLKLPNLPNARAVLAAAGAVQAAWPGQPVVHLRARGEDNRPERAENQPTEGNFLAAAAASRPRLLLFDGHGIYNDRAPNFSGLVFNLARAGAQDDGEVSALAPGDGFLRVDELFGLDLSGTELVFLAACQTALGQVYRGEGINALTRAFLVQGSPAVIASLWAVSDQVTSILVRRFFAGLAEQPGADRAHLLCEIKRAISKSKEVAAPYYWAPFVLYGASAPPVRQ